MIEIRIAAELKAKCPKATLGCVEAAVETGDWSQVTVARGPRPPGVPTALFGPGAR